MSGCDRRGRIFDGDEVCRGNEIMKELLYFFIVCLGSMFIGISVSGCHTYVRSSSVKSGSSTQIKERQRRPDTTDGARLRPGLVINVNVLLGGKKEIEAIGERVSDKGTIAMPLLGVVVVKDLALDELGSKLTAAYKEYFVNPQVIVEFVRDDNKEGLSPWGSVTVLGRVKKPGRIVLPATRDLTLSGAIQQAGGYDTSAKENGIRITRKNPEGGVKTWEVDLRSVGAEGLIENDILLEPDDVVFIRELIF